MKDPHRTINPRNKPQTPIEASLEFTVAQQDFNPNSFWDRFNGSGNLSQGAGASVELRLNGTIGLKGKVELA